MGRVLIVEDEAPQREVLRLYLGQAGLAVDEAATGSDGWSLFVRTRPDLVLIDLGLPGLSGESLLRKIREVSALPVLVMTARVQEETALAVFRLGADDFLRKPFSPREAAARVVRRLEAPGAAPPSVLVWADPDLRLDLAALEVRSAGEPIDLTPLETDLLAAFLNHPGQVLSRERLLDLVWTDGGEGTLRTVDAHVKNLRRKVPPRASGASPIETVYGRGYRWALR